jgi:thiol:disulfide interchange protein
MIPRQALLALLYALMTLVLAGNAATAQGTRHLTYRLVPETARPAPGGSVEIALVATPEAGWHGYWKNGGDAGVETTLAWTLPGGVTAGPLRYPVPGRLIVAGLMNYVYEKPFVQFVTLTLPKGIAPGTTLPVSVKADYLVCTTEICVPETQTLATQLVAGDGAIDPATRAQFDQWRQALPKPLGSPATYQIEGGAFRLGVPFPTDATLGVAYFYPLASGAIDYAAPQTVARDGDRLVIATKKASVGTAPATLEGVLAVGEGRGFALSAKPGVVPAARGGSSGGEGAAGWSTALIAFAGALIGGVLLNIMPCVFPILSLKALSLARSGESEAAARRDALAYTAGVVLVCVGLGAGLLALRAGGATVGWAFQLQDPRVILVLLLLVVAIALNLAGLFELPTPRFAGESGAMGAFGTGALAAFVATPCTGPFMGAALGAALVLPTAAAMLIFAGLGLGIALPFLLLGFVPALRRRLPRPGAWMNTFRHILSVPMWLTALALGWVLGRQAGVDGLVLGLAAALLAGLGLWWTGARQAKGRSAAWAPGLIALVVALGAGALVKSAPVGAAQATAAVPGAEPFSEVRLAALRAEGRPVFAYFTADWCLTCKVNEKAAIETATTADAFGKGKVAVLVGDWTDGDPALGRFIERHNRAGVPLYLWYKAGATDARVLPQVLTPGMLAALPTE